MRKSMAVAALALGLAVIFTGQVGAGDLKGVPISTSSAIAPFPQAQLTRPKPFTLKSLVPSFLLPGDKPFNSNSTPSGQKTPGSDYLKKFQAQQTSSK